MKISICTLTARRGFADLMAAMIANQEYPKELLEWVLVDFAYEERVSTLKELCASLGLSFIHSPNVRGGPLFFRDITRNRNLALRLATGDAVIFLDDYVMVPKEFVKEHLVVLKNRALSAGRMFRLEMSVGDPSVEKDAPESPISLYRDPPQILGRWAATIGKDYRDRGTPDPYKATGISYTGNLGIPREIFEQLNGFDPRMESGLEDCDFGLRASMAKFSTFYNPKAYTINLSTGNAPYTFKYDHAHDVEPFICNPNNHFRGDSKLGENDMMRVEFHPAYRIAVCKICGARGMIDPNELMAHKDAVREWRVPAGLSGGYC